MAASTLEGLGRKVAGHVDRWLPAGRGISLLAYHRVGGRTRVSVDLPTEQLDAQLDWLCEHALVVSLDDALARLHPLHTDSPGSGDDARARPLVVLTADDGTADWSEELLPRLVERSLPMTWYVATQYVDEQRSLPHGIPITWAGLRDADATGLITIGSHTHSHAVMARLGRAEAAAELDRSRKLLEDMVGVACEHFAYPKALPPSAAADREVRVRFTSAALAGNRVNVPGNTDPCRLGRTPITTADSAERFARKARGGARVEGRLREWYDRSRHRSVIS
jgi:peptidoglycan/xylan/chitin deacetylase (PgdA/CDA1 family)